MDTDNTYLKIALPIHGHEEKLKGKVYRQYADLAIAYCHTTSNGRPPILTVNEVVKEGKTADSVMAQCDAATYDDFSLVPLIEAAGLGKENGRPEELVLRRANEGPYGAAGISDRAWMDKACDLLGSDVMVIPSSIHEVIIMPDTLVSVQDINTIIKAVNKEVEPEDRLSDHCYHYSKDTGEFEDGLAWQFKKAMQTRNYQSNDMLSDSRSVYLAVKNDDTADLTSKVHEAANGSKNNKDSLRISSIYRSVIDEMKTREQNTLVAERKWHFWPKDTKFEDFADTFVNEVMGKLIDEGYSPESGLYYDGVEDPPVWKAMIYDIFSQADIRFDLTDAYKKCKAGASVYDLAGAAAEKSIDVFEANHSPRILSAEKQMQQDFSMPGKHL